MSIFYSSLFRGGAAIQASRYGGEILPDSEEALEMRPIFHKTDAAITGHLFTSSLVLFLMHELTQRLKKRGWKLG